MSAEISKNCILCKSDNAEILFRSFEMHGKEVINSEKKFNIYRCSNCNAIFLGNILIDENYYKKYYTSDYYVIEAGLVSKVWSLVYRCFSKKKEKIILKNFSKREKINLLDVGCGSGVFLESLKSKRIKKSGLEINSQGIELCKKKGFNIYEKNIIDTDFEDEKFDAITMWHVLEHLPNPQEIFQKIREILSDDGVLIFQIPNSDSLGFRCGKEHWFHLDSPRHLGLYNKKSIKYLCKKTGLKVVDIRNEFYDYPLDLFWSVRKSLVKYIIHPLYPFFKYFSKEHLTFICKKDGSVR